MSDTATLGDLVARDRRSDAIAIRTDPAERAMSYHDFCTTAWKAGNFLRYLGVGSDDSVAIEPDPRPEPVLALFGTALLGARVRFDVDSSREPSRVVVTSARREREITLSDRGRLLVYGDRPDRARTAHWESDVWSENPAFPPTAVDSEAAILTTATRSLSHATVLDAAKAVVSAYNLDAETTVAVRDGLAEPSVLVAGVIAPLLAGGTIVFPDPDTVCDVTVGTGPEPVRVDLDSISPV